MEIMESKSTLVQQICDALEFTDLSVASDSMSSIDLSHHGLTNKDLANIIKALKNNEKCEYFDNIKSINLSHNKFSSVDDENDIIYELFALFGQRFRNLQVIILCNSGINPAIYNDKKLKSLQLSASITWFDHNDDEEDGQTSEHEFDFISDDEDDDDDDDDKLQTMHITTECASKQVDDERDEFIKESVPQSVSQRENKLKIEYSLNMNICSSIQHWHHTCGH